MLPELQPHHIEDHDLRKRAKYLKRYKDALWCRWTSKYLRGLREKHQLKHKHGHIHPSRGGVFIIKSEEKNRGLRKLGIIGELKTGQDGVMRGAKLRAGKSMMERPVQLLYPLEISSERLPGGPNVDLDPTVPAFRPKRHAAAGGQSSHTGPRPRRALTAVGWTMSIISSFAKSLTKSSELYRDFDYSIFVI